MTGSNLHHQNPRKKFYRMVRNNVEGYGTLKIHNSGYYQTKGKENLNLSGDDNFDRIKVDKFKEIKGKLVANNNSCCV